VQNKEGKNIVVTAEEAERIEKDVKDLHIPEQTSQRKQDIEKYIYDRYIYLRDLQKE